MSVRSLLVASVLAIALPAAPAHAAPAPAPAEAGPDPLLAGVLAVGAPLALAGGASWLNASGALIGRPALDALHYAAIFGAPAAFGLGHAYAGDPRRAAAVGLGGLAATYGAIGAGVGVVGLGMALDGPGGPPLGPSEAWVAGSAVALVGIAGYGMWAALDAALTAEEAREAAR